MTSAVYRGRKALNYSSNCLDKTIVCVIFGTISEALDFVDDGQGTPVFSTDEGQGTPVFGTDEQTWGELIVNANALIMHSFFPVIQGND